MFLNMLINVFSSATQEHPRELSLSFNHWPEVSLSPKNDTNNNQTLDRSENVNSHYLHLLSILKWGRTDNSLQGSAFSLYHVVPGVELRSSGPVLRTFYHWAIWSTPFLRYISNTNISFSLHLYMSTSLCVHMPLCTCGGQTTTWLKSGH